MATATTTTITNTCLLCSPARSQCVRSISQLNAAAHQSQARQQQKKTKTKANKIQKHICLIVAPPLPTDGSSDSKDTATVTKQHLMAEGNRIFQRAGGLSEQERSENKKDSALLISGNVGAIDEVGGFEVSEYECLIRVRHSDWERFLGVLVMVETLQNARRISSKSSISSPKSMFGGLLWKKSDRWLEMEKVFVDDVAMRLKDGGFGAHPKEPFFEVWRVTAQSKIPTGVSIMTPGGKRSSDRLWTSKTEGFVEPPGSTMRCLRRKISDYFPGSWEIAELSLSKNSSRKSRRGSSDSESTKVGDAQFFEDEDMAKAVALASGESKLVITNT